MILLNTARRTGKIQKGDLVRVTTGEFRGIVGRIVSFPKENHVYVSNVYRIRKTLMNEGKIRELKQFKPVHMSNVAIHDPSDGRYSKVSFTRMDGRKIRLLKKNGTVVTSRYDFRKAKKADEFTSAQAEEIGDILVSESSEELRISSTPAQAPVDIVPQEEKTKDAPKRKTRAKSASKSETSSDSDNPTEPVVKKKCTSSKTEKKS